VDFPDSKSIGGFGKLSFDSALTKKAQALSGRMASADPAQRQKVAQEFVSFLYQEVLKAMRATLPQDGFGEKSEALSRDIYTSMMDAEIAKAMAKRDSSGFAKTVEKALDKMITPRARTPNETAPPSDGVVSSLYGMRKDPFSGHKKFHSGIDIAAPAGTPVKAAAPGKVSFSGPVPGYGNLVEIDHGGGLVTRYGHNSANLVAVGDRIEAGQAIALIGSTGRATGAHVHFEVRRAGKPSDPESLLGELTKGTKIRATV
jgi:murein DD-endopeptidase MepM/ murein hydrolase activator NlpD